MTWLFFSPSGRIGRKTYALAWLFWLLLLIVPLIQIFSGEDNTALKGVAILVFFVAGLAFMVSSVMLTIKRLHDIGIPGAVCICLFIPAISIIALVAFCVWPGKPDANEYGRLTNWPKDGVV